MSRSRLLSAGITPGDGGAGLWRSLFLVCQSFREAWSSGRVPWWRGREGRDKQIFTSNGSLSAWLLVLCSWSLCGVLLCELGLNVFLQLDAQSCACSRVSWDLASCCSFSLSVNKFSLFFCWLLVFMKLVETLFSRAFVCLSDWEKIGQWVKARSCLGGIARQAHCRQTVCRHRRRENVNPGWVCSCSVRHPEVGCSPCWRGAVPPRGSQCGAAGVCVRRSCILGKIQEEMCV